LWLRLLCSFPQSIQLVDLNSAPSISQSSSTNIVARDAGTDAVVQFEVVSGSSNDAAVPWKKRLVQPGSCAKNLKQARFTFSTKKLFEMIVFGFDTGIGVRLVHTIGRRH
jgi:hypothetical protein